MKINSIFAITGICFIIATLALSSCAKDPEMDVSTDKIHFEANPSESLNFGISSNGEWSVEVIQEEEWLTVSPLQGKGNLTITLEAEENVEFTERIAFLVISGEVKNNDTIRVTQDPCLDVALKIVDDVFRQYCLNKFDQSPQDGRISSKEAMSVMEIIVKRRDDEDEAAITSLVGIEYFTNLRKLDCAANNIAEIDLSKNIHLRILDCSFNPISKIDVGELYRLEDLHLHSTNIQEIDVSKNALLYLLTTSNSPIKSLDVTKNQELAVLLCNDNQLTELDVSKNLKLLMLFCGNNRLSKIDISMNTSLVNLWCNNQTDGNNRKLLSSLDVSNNRDLQSLSCGQNNISVLHLTNNTVLTQLRCEDNQLTDLDVSKNTKLGDLKSNNNNLSGILDLSNNASLKYVDLRVNELNTIYVWQTFYEECTFSVDGKVKCYEKDDKTQWVVK